MTAVGVSVGYMGRRPVDSAAKAQNSRSPTNCDSCAPRCSRDRDGEVMRLLLLLLLLLLVVVLLVVQLSLAGRKKEKKGFQGKA